MKCSLPQKAATLPIQMSCIGMSVGKGSALLSTSRLNAMQQPV